jgi:uncharacterized metal-binding protein YceD (DUF177 family)
MIRQMGALVIPLHDLDTHGKDFSFSLDESWLNAVFAGSGFKGDVSQGPGRVDVHAQRNGQEILVHGHAKARLLGECGRCLKDMPIDVQADIATLYAPADPSNQARRSARAREDEDIEIDPEAPDREYYSGDQVVIDDLVRDYLMLEVPMQLRCDLGWACPNLDLPEHLRTPEGVGIKGFGEGDIDPRLSQLKKLVKDEPSKE